MGKVFKKTAIVATAAAGLLAIGSPALATTPSENESNENTSQFGLINVDDVLSDNQINVCDVLDLQALPILGANATGDTTCTNAVAENDH